MAHSAADLVVRTVILLALTAACYGPTHLDGDGGGVRQDGDSGCGPELCGDGIDGDCQNDPDPPCPVNDRPEDPVDISAGGPFSGDLTFAHDDATASCGQPGGRDLFYELTLSTQEVVYLDTIDPQATFDTILSIRQGRCTSQESEIACADDSCGGYQSQLAAALAAGTYCVIVDQADAAQTRGAFMLHVVRGLRAGTRIDTGPGVMIGDTCAATDASTPDVGCALAAAPDVAYWFTLCNTTSYNILADSCGSAFESVVYLRRGSSLSASLACDGEGCTPNGRIQTLVTVDQLPGLFWLILDGKSSGTCGAFQLSTNIY